MKILIVGHRGMLGTDLMEVFQTGHEVLGIDLPDLDITKLGQCLSITGEFRPHAILNAAAFTRVDDCETHQEQAFLVNAEGAGNIAKAAATCGSLLVHYSTDYVFDGLKKGAYLEDDATNPQSIYGKSKLMGEDFVRRNCPDHMILRTSWLFGQNGTNFIRTIFNAAKQGNSLRVVNDQRGCPTYTRDLARCTLKMIEAHCRATYHVTNSGSCTWFELACGILQWAGMQDVPITPVSTSEYKRPAPRPANSMLANARLQHEGFGLMRSWDLAAREYVAAIAGRQSSATT